MIQFQKTLLYYKLLLFAIVISFFSFTSCKTKPITKSKIVGKYSCKISDHHNISLMLEESGRFIYDYNESLNFMKSEGEWFLKDNTLILNSWNIGKEDYIIVEENNSKPKRCIEIKYYDNLSFQYCTVILNNSEKMYADGNGLIFLDVNQKVESIKIELFDDITVYEYKPNNPDTKVFTITFMRDGFNTVYFNNEKGKFVHNMLKILNREFIKQ
ncbi:hypothetical protein E0W68_07170 [Flavobacterium salilacus subsp. salilacus]|uniref:hypothetical protein n=1 Tax=Flavobacterium TaxID=237 RepID=UPI001074F6C8|nr:MULTISPECIES: hypothetical protein [Flavobacterium]KAF2519031.1 hypothetical protein E0W68_07170 [Flavobacterium salilacus subsp. salilacus]MBE1614805.1 hypothetical protein [Flavobacterium sp. SaA2.13]